jgi:hypothetical protein
MTRTVLLDQYAPITPSMTCPADGLNMDIGAEGGQQRAETLPRRICALHRATQVAMSAVRALIRAKGRADETFRKGLPAEANSWCS